ncbi:MAG: MerR family transcriptional regulator [Phycisphaerales bacterium]|nr:MerR family transcriptional regulator [Phycisphaerales bacterium]
MNTLTIGQLAKAVGVPTSTVRYYERRELLQPGARSTGNYRLYDNASLDRLRFIKAAQTVGFTLNDISELLELKEDRNIERDEVQALINLRLGEIADKIKQLQMAQRLLIDLLGECKCDQSTGRCGVLAGLEASK